MDHSGNSGSLQSSSGAEEDYDSRAAADSIFMTTTHQPPPLLFDPFSNYMQLHHQNHINNNNSSSSLLHPNMDNWPRPATLRSDPNPPMLSPASAPGHLSSMPSFQVLPTAAGGESGGGVGPTRSNPKKRSRASRRAPTTVLTTDTTNFRAMVQEFTGVPAPPFTNSSFQPRTSRLDLFGTRSAAPPPYLRRPFAQKAHDQSPAPPPLSSSTTTTSSINYQLPIISTDQFNNIAPPNPLVFTNSLVTTSKPHHHEFGIQPENDVIGGLPNLISSDQTSYRGGNNNNTGSGWGAMNNNNDGVNGSGDYDRVKPNGGDDHRSNNIGNIIGGARRGGGGGGGGSSSQGMVESWICSSD